MTALRPAEHAVAAAVALAERLGLRVERPVVLSERSTIVVELAPHSVVARIPWLTAAVRDAATFAAREVAVGRELAARTAPVRAPSAVVPPGPHEYGDFVVTFWELLPMDVAAPPAEAIRALAEVHRALSRTAVELPLFPLIDETAGIVGTLARRRVLDRADAARCHTILASASPTVSRHASKLRRLHGDASVANAYLGPSGAVWTDFEDACLGPLEWDVACLVTRPRLLHDRPEPANSDLEALGPYRRALVDVLVCVRAVQVLAWHGLAALHGIQGRERMERYLARVREM